MVSILEFDNFEQKITRTMNAFDSSAYCADGGSILPLNCCDSMLSQYITSRLLKH